MKKSPTQLQIKHLDQMLWETTPLGKILTTIKKRSQQIFKKPAVITKIHCRDWVVRLPAASFFMESETGGFQTVVAAEDQAQALEFASESNVWEVLDFKVSNFQVFPSNPIEDEIAKRNK